MAGSERQIILAQIALLIREERSATLQSLEGVVLAAIQQGRAEATTVIDHTLWRIAQGAAVLILLLGAAFLLVLRRLGPRRET
jgi:hypothetical protein